MTGERPPPTPPRDGRRFHMLLQDEVPRGYLTVCGYDLGTTLPSFTDLCLGRPVGRLPADVRLEVRGRRRPDLLPSPLGWRILSERLLDLVLRLAVRDRDLEVFPAPVFEQRGGAPVPGYALINVIRHIACLDRDRARAARADPTTRRTGIAAKRFLALSRVPEDAHLFALGEDPQIVLVSDALAQSLNGHGLVGVAFLRADCA